MKKIVTIGGGTGSFVLLSKLKNNPVRISAIVTMADDGGSTGVLRDELGVLPPGDVRQCLVALSEESSGMRDLMNYRFADGGLRGHNFGNLFLSALEKIHGGFLPAVDVAMHLLNIRGKVIPVTGSDVRIHVELMNGAVISGEDNINNSDLEKRGVKRMFYDSRVRANPAATSSLNEADLIVIGPGNLYGSVLPNLLVPGIANAIKKAKANVVLNANITNKKGHTRGFEVDDYVNAIERYIGRGRINYVVFNTKLPAKKLIEKYERQEGKNMLVSFNPHKNPFRKYRLVRGEFIENGNGAEKHAADSFARKGTRSFIRHDGEKLAKVIVMISQLDEYKNVINDIVEVQKQVS